MTNPTYDHMITCRVTKKLKKKCEIMAGIYADGDMSEWIRHCIDNYQPKIVKKKRAAPKKKTTLKNKSKRY